MNDDLQTGAVTPFPCFWLDQSEHNGADLIDSRGIGRSATDDPKQSGRER
ncbi:hypothetical protein [Mesorhizobium caraganae]